MIHIKDRGRLACWLAASIVSVWVFAPGLRSWFFQDDFAWLGLGAEVDSFSSLLYTLFAPMAQGTIRPWSERAFFMGFYELFGLYAYPYRLAVFCTFVLCLWLFGTVARRLTGKLSAAFWAPALWGVNASLGTALSWTSSYNQIQVAAFLLGALVLFLRYLDTGERRWWIAQFAVFVLGFGALEINVVYPVLAASCALLIDRRRLTTTVPMFAASLAYTALHFAVAPTPETGPYANHFDASILTTFGYYWIHAFGAAQLGEFPVPAFVAAAGNILPWIFTAALCAYTIVQALGRNWVPATGLLWFAALIGPVLPLRDHLSNYYLTTPTLGLALVGASAIIGAWRSGWILRSGAFALALLYAASSGRVGRGVTRYNLDRSMTARRIVLGVDAVQKRYPGKTILLHGVGTEIFWSVIIDAPFRLIGARDVHLTPGSADNIEAFPELGDIESFVYPAGATLRALRSNQAVVYLATGGGLRNITPVYSGIAEASLKPELARRIELGSESYRGQIGEGWYAIQTNYRWMAQRAVAWLGEVRTPDDRLYLTGFCPAVVLANGPLHLTVKADDRVLASRQLRVPDQVFELAFDLPDEWTGKERIQLELQLDRAYTPEQGGDPLGIVVSSLEIR